MKTEFAPAESFVCEKGPVSAEYDTQTKRLIVELKIGTTEEVLRIDLSPTVAYSLDNALASLRHMHGGLGTLT